MQRSGALIATRAAITLALFLETLIYAYATFFGHHLNADGKDEEHIPQPFLVYCCLALAGSALVTAISVTCCCLDRIRNERVVDGLAFSFISALCLLVASQVIAGIVVLCLSEYRSAARVGVIVGLIGLTAVAIVMTKLQHYYTVLNIRGYHPSSSSSGSSSSSRPGGTARPTLAVPVGPGGVGGQASPPCKGVYVPLKQPDPEEYARLKEAAAGGPKRGQDLNMFDYYQVPDSRGRTPNTKRARGNSVEV